MDHHGSVALVVGATGMVGRSLVEALKKPTASGSPWTVYGLARRRPEPALPLPGLDRFIQLDVLDRGSTVRALSPLAPRVTHLFWVALAVLDSEEENIAANTAMLANVVDALTSASSSLRRVAVQTGSKHYYLGALLLDPEQAGGLVEVPFKEDSPRLGYPTFYYALEDLLATYSHKLMTLSWTVHRSSLIFGASSRSFYNILLTLATYASISKHEGSSRLVYPGSMYTWLHFCDASDAELLAEQQIWAATTDAARNQAFNCTNGDVFTWRSLWEALADAFGLDSEGPSATAATTTDGGEGWAYRMKGKGEVWEEIVQRNGLVRTRLEDITCYDAVFIVLNFRFQHVSSMNKSREFGFHNTVDTLKSVGKWIRRLADLKLIPKI